MSAGELFDLIRPAALVLSALLSTWVLASARKRSFRIHVSAAWALATLLFPPVVLPIFLIIRSLASRRQEVIPRYDSENTSRPARRIRFRFILPLVYLLAVLSFLGIYFHRDNTSVDAHLARATQAKVSGNRNGSIAEYRRALKLEDNPHTHKLLAIELTEAGYWTEALSELRLADRGGEPDDLISFRIAIILDSLGNAGQARLEYEKFLISKACTQSLPNSRCEVARRRRVAIQDESP